MRRKTCGFYFTNVTFDGPDAQAKLVIKNETMLLRQGGEIVCMFPDMVVMIEPGTGRGVMSVELRTGLELVLLALPCHPRLQAAALTDTGRGAMGPARFGHPDLTYRPMR